MDEWMNGWMDGSRDNLCMRCTQTNTLMRMYLNKVYFSSVYFIALQGSGWNTLAFNHIFALHEILVCFSG